MGKPTIEQLTGSWQVIKWISKKGTEFNESRHRWDLTENGKATYFLVKPDSLFMDENRQNWKVSDEPNGDGNYSIIINGKDKEIILTVEDKLLITKAADKGEATYYYAKRY
ncbi:unnamed protein product [Rotaria sp. Silwood2]|nr:unnamed protein product [Rotaria sp. Silwood2]